MLYFCILIIIELMKVYPGQQVGGFEADLMAANELSAHASLQVFCPDPTSSSICLYFMFRYLCLEYEMLIFAEQFKIHSLSEYSGTYWRL